MLFPSKQAASPHDDFYWGGVLDFVNGRVTRSALDAHVRGVIGEYTMHVHETFIGELCVAFDRGSESAPSRLRVGTNFARRLLFRVAVGDSKNAGGGARAPKPNGSEMAKKIAAEASKRRIDQARESLRREELSDAGVQGTAGAGVRDVEAFAARERALVAHRPFDSSLGVGLNESVVEPMYQRRLLPLASFAGFLETRALGGPQLSPPLSRQNSQTLPSSADTETPRGVAFGVSFRATPNPPIASSVIPTLAPLARDSRATFSSRTQFWSREATRPESADGVAANSHAPALAIPLAPLFDAMRSAKTNDPWFHSLPVAESLRSRSGSNATEAPTIRAPCACCACERAARGVFEASANARRTMTFEIDSARERVNGARERAKAVLQEPNALPAKRRGASRFDFSADPVEKRANAKRFSSAESLDGAPRVFLDLDIQETAPEARVIEPFPPPIAGASNRTWNATRIHRREAKRRSDEADPRDDHPARAAGRPSGIGLGSETSARGSEAGRPGPRLERDVVSRVGPPSTFASDLSIRSFQELAEILAGDAARAEASPYAAASLRDIAGSGCAVSDLEADPDRWLADFAARE